MTEAMIGFSILGIGLSVIVIAVGGTILMTWARNFKERRQPPKFKIEQESEDFSESEEEAYQADE